jgi:hypothetical protein
MCSDLGALFDQANIKGHFMVLAELGQLAGCGKTCRAAANDDHIEGHDFSVRQVDFFQSRDFYSVPHYNCPLCYFHN